MPVASGIKPRPAIRTTQVQSNALLTPMMRTGEHGDCRVTEPPELLPLDGIGMSKPPDHREQGQDHRRDEASDHRDRSGAAVAGEGVDPDRVLDPARDGSGREGDGCREERRGEKSEPGDRSPTWGWRPTIREQERDEDADDSGDRCEGHVCEQCDRHRRRPAAATSPSAPRRIGDAGHGPDKRDSAPPKQPAHQIAG